ncbi:MAG: STAS domain-containing protein [Mycobacterium sp.]|nr:STAS domain-containing protein [Mycobacterium sp.]
MSATFPLPNLTRYHDVYLSTQHSAGATVIAATGELDAASTDDFTTYAKAHTGAGQRLTVDLSQLKFFAVEGFSALEDIRSHCNRTGTTWSLVAGPAVHRVLKICDPTRRPLAVRSLQLVPQPGQGTRE